MKQGRSKPNGISVTPQLKPSTTEPYQIEVFPCLLQLCNHKETACSYIMLFQVSQNHETLNVHM